MGRMRGEAVGRGGEVGVPTVGTELDEGAELGRGGGAIDGIGVEPMGGVGRA